MSLQEDIAVLRARMVVLKPSCSEPAGRCPDLPYGVTAMPWTQYSFLASCLRYLTRVFLPRLRAHSSQTERPWVVPHRASAPTTPPARRRGGSLQGRGRYVPSRHQGVRREARTGSLQEQGTYRLDPSNPSGIL